MKLTKSQLKQLIKEELQRVLNEADVIKGPWPGSGETTDIPDYPPGEFGHVPKHLQDRPDEDNPPGYEYEPIQDQLGRAAADTILRKAIEIVRPYLDRDGDVRGVIQSLKGEIEDDLWDAMRPIAQSLYYAIEPFKAEEREEEETRQYLERNPDPDDDWLGDF